MRKFDHFDEDGFSPTNDESLFSLDMGDAIIIGTFVLIFVGVLLTII